MPLGPGAKGEPEIVPEPKPKSRSASFKADPVVKGDVPFAPVQEDDGDA